MIINACLLFQGYPTLRLFGIKFRHIHQDVLNGTTDSISIHGCTFNEYTASFSWANAKHLSLSDMDIRRITRESFHGLLNLETLRFTHLNLTTIDSKAFEDLPKLTSISISHSPLQTLDSMAHACCVTYISINYVSLHTLYFDSVASISSLKSLDFLKSSLRYIFPEIYNCTGKESQQAIPSADSDLDYNVSCSRYGKNARYKLSNLTSINLFDNSIKFIHPEVLNCFPSLTSLMLSNNLIEFIHANSFAGVEHLEILALSSNKITFLPKRLFSPLYNLKFVNLDRNSITSLSSESFYPVSAMGAWNKQYSYLPVITLILHSNNITSIEKDTFRKLVSLKILHLDRNCIRDLHVAAFHGLDNLKYLNLDHNGLILIQAGLFSALNTLHSLVIAHNEIYHLDMNAFANLTHLQVLQLNNNALSELHPNLFSDLLNLRELRLEVNNITFLHVETFQSLSKLMMLTLFDNQISSIEPGTFLPMTSLNILNMDGNQISNLTKEMILVPKRSHFMKNPFVCTCDLFWLKNVTKLTTKARLPSCENVSGIPIIDYLDRFCCGYREGKCKPGAKSPSAIIRLDITIVLVVLSITIVF